MSEEPDPDDPKSHLVAIWGETSDVAENGRRDLRSLLRREFAAAVDRVTPGVWQIVSTVIDSDKVSAKTPSISCACLA